MPRETSIHRESSPSEVESRLSESLLRRRSRSAADGRHRPGGLDEPGLTDVVLELLAPDGLANRALELIIVGAVAQRPAQVGLVEREQAGAQASIGCQTDAVAVARRTARRPG